MNQQIGDLFQGLTYSGVSKANHRFSLRMSQGKGLRKTVEKIAISMSNVKAPFLHTHSLYGMVLLD
jgi:hypothetical protein